MDDFGGLALEQAGQAVARLRAVAADSGGLVRLDAGLPDAVLDQWHVPVPDDIRLLAGEIGAVWFDEYSPITFSHPENTRTQYCRAGDRNTYWVLHSTAAADTYYVNIDPRTGAWGQVFSHWENNSAKLIAPTLTGWLLGLTTGLDLALRAARGEHVRGLHKDLEADDLAELTFNQLFDDWFGNHGEFFAPRAQLRATITEIGVAPDLDAELAELFSRLPGGALVADLRSPHYPTEIPFELPGETAVYRRLNSGRFLAAIPGRW